MPLLDIIVTHCMEPWKELVKPFLDSLNCQRSVDFDKFRVILVHDGDYMIYDDIWIDRLNRQCYKFDICQLWKKHEGVSAARNYGLDHASADWVCFCDCDDSFASAYALKWVFEAIENDPPYDMMWNRFYTNMLDAKDTVNILDEYNSIWVHNKYYRRKFLLDNGLRFNEELWYSEDSAFNNLVHMLAWGRIGEIHTAAPMYAWCRRKGSVTTDPAKEVRNILGHFYRNLYVLGEYKKHGWVGWEIVTIRTVTDAYALITKKERKWEDIWQVCARILAFYDENKDVIEDIRTNRWDIYMRALRASDREAGVDTDKTIYEDTRPTLIKWLEEIREKGKGEEK